MPASSSSCMNTVETVMEGHMHEHGPLYCCVPCLMFDGEWVSGRVHDTTHNTQVDNQQQHITHNTTHITQHDTTHNITQHNTQHNGDRFTEKRSDER